MFEIGFWELVMVGVVALLVVGPERLPGLARTVGLWLGKARRMVMEVKAEVDRELQLDELKQSLRQQADLNAMKDLGDRIKSLRQDIQTEYDDPGPPPGWRPGMPVFPRSDTAMPGAPSAVGPPAESSPTANPPGSPAVPAIQTPFPAQTPPPASVAAAPASAPSQPPQPPAAS
ncbi:MAG: Sec-independent protein translocase protein TatB [Candidatus Competibacteraceae bacterium]